MHVEFRGQLADVTSPSAVWVPELEPGLSGLAASTLTPSAILPALFSFGEELMDGGEVLRNLWHVLCFFFL